jgi:hypothetical protein
MRRGWLLGLALALGLALGSPQAWAQSNDSSLRIGTYNAYLMSPAGRCARLSPLVVDCLRQIEGQVEEWASRLAFVINANRENLDIVLINEAWDEDAKAILAEKLEEHYPVQVKKIDRLLVNPDGVDLEDSGLMLFAKRRYLPQPLPDSRYKWGATVSTETLDATTEHVAFAYFDECEDDDCWSAKGAGLIRLRDDDSNHIYNVVFTHMQADYPPDDLYVRTRGKQFRIIENLIRNTLPSLDERLASGDETVILAGDLNVPRFRTSAEYKKLFDRPASFFDLPLYETWARTTSSKDKTPTNSYEDERLDYILASPAPFTTPGRTAPMCVQHLTVPPSFRELESDHNMVHADINVGTYNCNPSLARRVLIPADATARIDIDTNQGLDQTWILRPGQMQWLKIEAASGETATYSLSINNSDLTFDVYLPEDLTTPVARENVTPFVWQGGAGETTVNQYVLPDTFYVRIHGKTRKKTGNYAFGIKRHTCATKAEACILTPGLPQRARLSPLTGDLQLQNQAWFKFTAVGKADSGERQTVTLVGDVVAPGRVTAQMEDFDNTSGGALSASVSGSKVTYQGKVGDGSEGYLLIKQASQAAQPTRVTASLDTNMRFLTVHDLVCMNETEPQSGSDDIFTVFTVDGNAKRAPATDYKEFDCDDNRPHSQNWVAEVGKRTLGFIDGVKVKVVEDDDISDNDNTRNKAIPKLPAGVNKLTWQSLAWRFSGGRYKFFYDLQIRPDKPSDDP